MSIHQFHIPVMGTAFTIDSPLKVAKFGISSVVSIVDDELCEYTRKYYAQLNNEPYEPIHKSDEDCRARRITAYLNLLDLLIQRQFSVLCQLSFLPGNDITKYFELLHDQSPLKSAYNAMLLMPDGAEKLAAQNQLRAMMRPGTVDVNIMTKLDRDNYSKDGELLPEHFSDALSSLRGYALSTLDSGIVFSAGFNRRLYAYIAQFSDFFPDQNGFIKKRIILKVSDFRSSQTQGRFLAKKGLWVSEHRIESGLNCGGHVFPSDGFLLGPILEEFKLQRDHLIADLFPIVNAALDAKGLSTFPRYPETKVTVQGGIGTAKEQQFLMDYYRVDGTGWGTPFLLVPEVTTLDDKTRQLLAAALPEDTYVSEISPLGVRFNTIKGTPSEIQKLERYRAGRPGSPCPKGYLVSNTEFTKKPICTASVLYQRRKLAALKENGIEDQVAIDKVIAKACLCEDLAAGALIDHDQDNQRPLATAVCPGPNIAYFSKIVSLYEMVGHIYGRTDLRNSIYRPNFFISEIRLYIAHLERETIDRLSNLNDKHRQYLESFRQNLLSGVSYYLALIPQLTLETESYQQEMKKELQDALDDILFLLETYPEAFGHSGT